MAAMEIKRVPSKEFDISVPQTPPHLMAAIVAGIAFLKTRAASKPENYPRDEEEPVLLGMEEQMDLPAIQQALQPMRALLEQAFRGSWTLFYHQLTGVASLCYLLAQGEPILLADSMGLGKTRTSIVAGVVHRAACEYTIGLEDAEYGSLLTHGYRLPIGVCCTVATREGWTKEIKNLTRKCTIKHSDYFWSDGHTVAATANCPVWVVFTHGDVLQHAKTAIETGSIIWSKENSEVLAGTKHGMRRLCEQKLIDGQARKQIQKIFSLLLIDEIHELANPESVVANVVWVVSTVSGGVIGLSGTPFVNDISDVWNICCLIGCFEILSRLDCWKDKNTMLWLEGKSDEFPSVVRAYWKQRIQRGKEFVKLPDLNMEYLDVDFTPGEIELYLELVDQFEKNPLQTLGKMRRTCLEPMSSSKIDRAVKESKRRVLELGTVGLIFDENKDSILELERRLSAAKIRTAMIDGGMSGKERQAVAERLGTPNSPQVVLCSIKAAGTGINLQGPPGRNTQWAIIMQPWWNTVRTNQARDRLHRLGNEQEQVDVMLLTHRYSVDSAVHRIAVTKGVAASRLAGCFEDTCQPRSDRKRSTMAQQLGQYAEPLRQVSKCARIRGDLTE